MVSLIFLGGWFLSGIIGWILVNLYWKEWRNRELIFMCIIGGYAAFLCCFSIFIEYAITRK